jgi:hypothetical protein
MSEPTLDNLARSFERHLRAENKSPKMAYLLATLGLFVAWVRATARRGNCSEGGAE